MIEITVLDYAWQRSIEARCESTSTRPVPTLEQIRPALAAMPTETDIDHRNRAHVATTLLTGARVGAIASMKCKHLDLIGGSGFWTRAR